MRVIFQANTSRDEYKCNLCDAHKHTVMFEEPAVFGEQFAIVKCDACGFVSTYPLPSKSFSERLYGQDSYQDQTISAAYCSDEDTSSADFNSVLLQLAKTSPSKGRLLDVGCGRGLFMGRAMQDGWDVYGIDPSPYAGGIAKASHGDRVRIGYFDASSFPRASFDAITLWYVLEHVSDPRNVLAAAFEVLKPGGLIFVAVPNWHFLVIRRQLGRLRHGRPGLVHAHEHLSQFTSKTARAMFRKVGFDVLKEMPTSPFLVSGAAINSAKKIAHFGVRLLFQATGRNMAGIMLVGRKPTQEAAHAI